MPKLIKYNKLVRDNVPDIILSSGKFAKIRVASNDEEYKLYLFLKLVEELKEFMKDPNVEELADMFEVVFAIGTASGFTPAELAEKVRKKGIINGVFEKRYILEEVEIKDEDKKENGD